MMTISRESDSAREWLMDKSGANTPLFAYTNGKHTPAFEARLGDIGYQIVALFDHRVHRVRNPPQMSRIRVNSTDSLSEFKAKVSGIHPVIHRALDRS